MFQQNNKIKTFLTLAEELNYTKTAKIMFMSQQAVSRCVASLENELNVQLFVRTTRSVELTPAGRQYYALFNDINKLYEERLALINKENNDEGNSSMRLGIHSLMDASPVIDVVEYFKNKKSQLKIDIFSAPPSALVDEFQRNMLDAIILIDRFMPDSFSARKRKLISYPLYLMISENNPNFTEDATFEDLMSLPFISDMFDGEDSLAHKARLDHAINTWGLSPEETIWAYDRGAAVTYAELGYGVIIDSNRSKVTVNKHLHKFDTGTKETLWLVFRQENISTINLNLLSRKLKEAFENSLMPYDKEDE